MNPTDILPVSTTAWLGDALLQSTALLGLALIANVVLARRPASWLHAVLLAAAIGVPLLFSLSAILPAWKLPHSAALSGVFNAQAIEVEHSISLGAPGADSMAAGIGGVTQSSSPVGATSLLPARNFFVEAVLLLWLLGTLVVLARLFVGILVLGRIKGVADRSPELLDLVAREARRCGLVTTPHVLLLVDAAMPMTWRIRHHVLALPVTAVEWPVEKLQRVLRHELAHIQREDCRSAWLADACLAAVWFHPFAWLLRRAINRTREAACDDLALGRRPDGNARGDYAQDLLEVVAHHARQRRRAGLAFALAMASRRSGIHVRLDAILDPSRDRRPLPRRARLWATPVWLLGLAGLATLGACRSTDEVKTNKAAAPVADTSSHVSVQIQTVEVDDAALLEKLFRAKREGGSFTGVISADDLKVVLAKLKASGAEMKSMPTVVTRYGKSGTAKKIREVIYPTKFDPPEMAAAEGGFKPIKPEDLGEAGAITFPITPANPTDFDTREIGFKSTIKTGRVTGGKTSLDIALDHSQFLGLINYGSPIYATAKGLFGRPVEVILTENRIEQPVFNTVRLNVNLDVAPGESIAIVGFAPDRVKAMDKIDRSKRKDRNRAALRGPEDARHTLYIFTPRPFKP